MRLSFALSSNYDPEVNSSFCTPDTGLNQRGRVVGEVENNNFDRLPDNGGHSRLNPSKLCVP